MPAVETFESGVLDASPWWAVYTRHHHEKAIADMLTAKGFKVFLPLYESIRRWKDRKMVLSLPLFPCYLFVRGGLDRKLQVVTTPGIYTILYRGEQVAIIPDREMEAIRRAINGPCNVEPYPFLKCGTRVRVIRGALEGVEGILIRKKNLFRLILSVDMLAQSVAVEVHASDVERCAPVQQPSELRSSSLYPGQNRTQTAIPLRVTAS
ncbi:MAG: UpxY family transcription antiterminator [Terracidiphilus sp.]|jgi:transcription antitermination factor NusG